MNNSVKLILEKLERMTNKKVVLKESADQYVILTDYKRMVNSVKTLKTFLEENLGFLFTLENVEIENYPTGRVSKGVRLIPENYEQGALTFSHNNFENNKVSKVLFSSVLNFLKKRIGVTKQDDKKAQKFNERKLPDFKKMPKHKYKFTYEKYDGSGIGGYQETKTVNAPVLILALLMMENADYWSSYFYEDQELDKDTLIKKYFNDKMCISALNNNGGDGDDAWDISKDGKVIVDMGLSEDEDEDEDDWDDMGSHW